MKMNLLAIAALIAGVCYVGEASAQSTATQKFTVSVPSSISITAPSNVALTHDQSDNNQAFPAQVWTVKGNSQNGVSVVFATNQAFTHTSNNAFKRDAKLDLSLGAKQGPANWAITKATDTTNFASRLKALLLV